MDAKMAVAFASLAITMIVGFVKIIASQARLEFKVDLMWDKFIKNNGPALPGGRRAHDPPAPARDESRGHATND